MDSASTKNRRKIGRTGRPRKITIVNAGNSAAFRTSVFDGRTKVFKLYKAHVAALEEHLGGDLTPPQSRLVDQAARLALLAELIWADIDKHGVLKNGDARPVVDTYLKATKEERDVLRLLGLQRRTARAVSLSEYITQEHSNDDE